MPDLQAHLRSHPRQALSQEVRRSHPRFDRAERVLDRLPSQPPGLRHVVEPLLHGSITSSCSQRMMRRSLLVVQSLRIGHLGQADDQYLRIAMPVLDW